MFLDQYLEKFLWYLFKPEQKDMQASPAPWPARPVLLRSEAKLAPENQILVDEFYSLFPEKKASVTFGQSCQPVHRRCGNQSTILLPPPTINDRPFAAYVLTDYFNKIAVADRLPPPQIPDAKPYRENSYWHQFAFDHETGHCLDDNSADRAYSRHQRECFADIFGLIRHYQRHGIETGFDRALLHMRARLTGLMDNVYSTEHMTAACLLAVAVMSPAQKQALASLSPQQAVEGAFAIVSATALSPQQQKTLAAIAQRNVPHGDNGDHLGFSITVAETLRSQSDLPDFLAPIWLDSVRTMQAFSNKDREKLSSVFAAVAEDQRKAPRPPDRRVPRSQSKNTL